MSLIDTRVTNEMVIPTVETNFFEGHEEARFAVGLLAVGSTIIAGRDQEYIGYLRLRANVYADQTGMISKEHVLEDGTERDTDDLRSVHFGVFENIAGNQRVVAAMRLIIKSREDSSPLPIEDFFPEAFESVAAPNNSAEISRYICRHESPKVQAELKWPLYTQALSYGMAHRLGNPATYAVVEAPLENQLTSIGIPLKRIAEPKFVPEYNADNLALEINIARLAHVMKLDKTSTIEATLAVENELTYFGAMGEKTGLAVA